MSTETLISLTISLGLGGLCFWLVGHVVQNSGQDRMVDPEAVKELMRTIDWSRLDSVMDRPSVRQSETDKS
ncbi:hypothetical protein HW561_13905 [Rhodobacteraceae bacterium B1Z28]|uniref:Uncharacterized protein n=1 Tax=Ruegeria haliotis TaxID=2747601 RepID=A0ABX2PV26_9RHOB|nr:hypothetical protein [Ruegeria haliotis]NVO56884.1 hypothetical protein [Ruegeria haliotis]